MKLVAKTASLPSTLVKKVQQIIEAEGGNFSEYTRIALIEYVQKWELKQARREAALGKARKNAK